MARSKDNAALQVIFSFFLGLMVLAFIVVGVITFYPAPSQKYEDQMQKLSRQQERYNMKQLTSLTPAEQAEMRRIQDKMDALNRKQQAEQEVWARNTSIILILFATAVMAVSLIRSEQLRVLSNGLLMGGLFTMVAGVVWVLFAGESVARFIVILFAFVATLALGYVKFVREREEKVMPAGAAVAAAAAGAYPVGAADAGYLAEVTARLDRLEARTAAAAAALGAERGATGSREAQEPEDARES